MCSSRTLSPILAGVERAGGTMTSDKAIDAIVFSDAIKQVQERMGSRVQNEITDDNSGWARDLTENIKQWIALRDSLYLGTASAAGQPYIQHRGGPAGFVQVLDQRTLGFADFSGNRQYITTGNLSENTSAFIFFMSYETRQRVKFWGKAEIVEEHAIRERLMPRGYEAIAERAILFHVEAWSVNCPQHINPRYTEGDIQKAVRGLQNRIVELETELAALKSGSEFQGAPGNPSNATKE